MDKKRAIIIVVALFLLIGLGTFLFINNKSLNDDNVDQKEPQSEIKPDTDKDNDDNNQKDEDSSDDKKGGSSSNSSSNHSSNSNSNIATIDRAYADALIAVSKAEQTLTQEDIDSAKELIEAVTSKSDKDALIEKINQAQNTLDIMNKVEEFVSLVDNASSIDDIEQAREYLSEHKLKANVNSLTNKEIKEKLINELNRVNVVLSDKDAPKVEGIKDGEITNESVSLIVSDKSEVSLLLNGTEVKVDNLKNIEESGIYTLEVIDKSFNKIVISFTIDKSVPIFSVEDNTITNKDLEIIVTDFALDYVLIDNNTSLTSAMAPNNNFTLGLEGEYTLTAVDKFGQKSTINVTIDKTVPTAEISYDITTLTNKDVTVTLINPSEDIIVLNNDGKLSYTFEENGTFSFKISDKAGNAKTYKTEVNYIDKTLAEIEIGGVADEKYVHQGQDFDVTITEENFDSVYYIWHTSEDIEEGKVALETIDAIKVDEADLIKNEDGTYTFKVSEWTIEGEYYFNVKVVDKAGNVAYAIKGPFNFDKTAPIADVSYDITTPTNGTVTATLINPSEDITVINNEGSLSYTFEENGTFMFEIMDIDGKISTVIAEVENIDKEAPIVDVGIVVDVGYRIVVVSDEELQEIDGLTKMPEGTYVASLDTIPENFAVYDLAGNKTDLTIINNITITDDLENPGTKNLELTFNKVITIESEEWILDETGTSIKKSFTKNGEAKINVQDEEGNITNIVYDFTEFDEEAPIAYIKVSVSADNYEVVVTPNEEIMDIEGFGKLEDGSYITVYTELPDTLEITDLAGNVTSLPLLTSISEYKNPDSNNTKDVAIDLQFNKEVTMEDETWIIDEETATIKKWYTENGDISITATDKAGNTIVINYTVTKVDENPPEVFGVEEGKEYQSVIITAEDDKTEIDNLITTIDDIPYTLGTEYNVEGTHILKVMDTSGNPTAVNFTIVNPIIVNNE